MAQIIKTVQWLGDNEDEVEEKLGLKIDGTFKDVFDSANCEPVRHWALMVPTPHGDVHTMKGDYIAKDEDGDYHILREGRPTRRV